MRRVGTIVCDMYTSLFVALESGHGCSPESAEERENICVAVWRIKKLSDTTCRAGGEKMKASFPFLFLVIFD